MLRSLLLTFFVAFSSIVLVSTSHGNAAETNARRPNILFVYTDDQAPWGFGASGYDQANTPNIDSLAEEGVRFTNAFVTTPVCSPARVSVMTSRYASEYGVFDFIPHPGHRLYDAGSDVGLPPETVTFPEVLQETGYRTGLVGKFHVGDWTMSEHRKYHPTNHGFDYFMGLTGGGTKPDNPPLEKNGVVENFEGLTTDILTDYAMEFVRDHQEHPFLLCVHYRAPHSKWLPVADEDWALYADVDPEIPNPDYPGLKTELVKQKTREYLASISGVDRNLGRLLKLLEELNLREETVVIFTSDHGYNMGHNGITHKGNGSWVVDPYPLATEHVRSGDRPNMYDNSIKVPLVVRWPSHIQRAMVIDDTVTSLDWYPTLVDLAGSTLPADHLVRGRSLVPLFKGEIPADWEQDYYGEYSQIHYSRADMRCYRTREWKLTRDFLDPSRNELYHLTEDPMETTNLYDESRAELKRVIDELSRKMEAKMAETGDRLLNPSSQ